MTLFPEEITCAVCGTKNEFQLLGSYSTFGGPDLDLRPAEMKRSTMPYWVQKCPCCGYVARQVSDPAPVTEEWLKTEDYITCNGISFSSDLAKEFYQQFMISDQGKDTETAFYALLHAAWACDDRRDKENAKHCREMACSIAEKLLSSKHKKDENLSLLRADLLRRSGQFSRLIDEYSNIRYSEDLLNDIIAFQLEKAKEHDAGLYRVKDVTGK